jgi:hypothetical protein
MFTRSKSRAVGLPPNLGTNSNPIAEPEMLDKNNPENLGDASAAAPKEVEEIEWQETDSNNPEEADESQEEETDPSEAGKIALVKQLYRDINFSGSFSGINNMQRSIFLEKGIYISRSLINKALNEIPTYVQHLRPIRKFERSKYKVTAFGEVCQADIAYMFDFEGFKYFLLLIDLFSHRIFTRPQKTKNKADTLDSIKDIISEGKLEIYTLQTDQGMEFKGNKTALKKMKIHWVEKVGQNKASFAEQVMLNCNKFK